MGDEVCKSHEQEDLFQMQSASPKRVTAALRKIVDYLGLDKSAALLLKYHRPSFEAEPDNCHLNVWVQVNSHGGAPQHGWVLSEAPSANFCEARFHAVWQSPEDDLFDVTPRADREKRILFIPDYTRQITLSDHKGAPAIITYDNVRFVNGELQTGLTKFKLVLQGDMIYRFGLAKRR